MFWSKSLASSQVGFIAEQVNTIDPRLVVFDASSTPFSVKYENLTAILAKAVQEIATISGAFKANMIGWLGNSANGITDFVARRGHFSDELCVGDTCVTPAQFKAMVAASAASATSNALGQAVSGSSASPTSNLSPSTSATLTLNGNNPVGWTLGAAWQDNLGALFTHPSTGSGQAAGSETIYSTTTVNTTITGTTTLDYWATYYPDPNATSSAQYLHTTREVVVTSPNTTSTQEAAATTQHIATSTGE